MPDGKASSEQFRGWLLKWTNYIKGYQRRWFVLSNGLLSYYRFAPCTRRVMLSPCLLSRDGRDADREPRVRMIS